MTAERVSPLSNDCFRGHTRWMIRRDLERVLEIENGNFDSIWEEKDILNSLRQRNCIGTVIEIGREPHTEVVGYLIYELYEKKLSILKLVVDQHYRRCKLGTQLMSKLVSKLSLHRRKNATIEVHERNLGAQLFLRGQGFVCTQTLKSYYESDEDAYLMMYRLKGAK